MDGWTWADENTISGLFNTYLAAAGGSASGYPLSGASAVDETDSSWAPAFLADFTPTSVWTYGDEIQGWLLTSDTPYPASVAALYDRPGPDGQDVIITSLPRLQFIEGPTLGAWFVREVPGMAPVPGTLFLFGLGVLGLRVCRLP